MQLELGYGIKGGAMNELDFFVPAIERSAMHNHFKVMLKPRSKPVRDMFNHWAKGFIDRDKKIVKEFQTEFNSTFWEVYLHALFTELGLHPSYEHPYPDFLIDYKGTKISIEAVIANNAQNAPKESEHKIRNKRIETDFEFNKSSMVRYLQAITTKYEKYKTSYSKLNHVKDNPFIIALGGYDQPGSYLAYDRAILAVLYGLYVDERGDYDGEIAYAYGTPVKKISSVTKSSGTQLNLGLFTNDRMKEVSAVIFSCGATFSKLVLSSTLRLTAPLTQASYYKFIPGGSFETNIIPAKEYSETIQDSLCVFHNPFAERPLPKEIFTENGIANYYLDVESGVFKRYINGSFLVVRSSNIIHISDNDPSLKNKKRSNNRNVMQKKSKKKNRNKK